MMTSTYPTTSAFTNTNENLIDFGEADNSHYSQQTSTCITTTTTDLILLNDNMSFATATTPSSSETQITSFTTVESDTKALVDRDDTFVNSFPTEII